MDNTTSLGHEKKHSTKCKIEQMELEIIESAQMNDGKFIQCAQISYANYFNPEISRYTNKTHTRKIQFIRCKLSFFHEH